MIDMNPDRHDGRILSRSLPVVDELQTAVNEFVPSRQRWWLATPAREIKKIDGRSMLEGKKATTLTWHVRK